VLPALRDPTPLPALRLPALRLPTRLPALRDQALRMCGVVALGLSCAIGSSCGGAQPAPPRPPEPSSALELMPRDLDFVVRLDAVLLAQTALASAALSELADHAAPAMVRDALDTFGNARAIAFGGRWMPDGLHGDGVVAIERGEDANSEALPAPGRLFRERPVRAGGRMFERIGPARRDEAVLEVMIKSGLVLATDAEADAVLRVLENGPDRDRLEPPARGLISFALRVPEGSRPSLPLLRDLMPGLLRVDGTLVLLAAPASGLLLDADFAYRSATEANAAARACAEIAEALARAPSVDQRWHAAAESARAVQVGSGLRLTFQLPFARRPEVH
jgi:hypothetical protein